MNDGTGPYYAAFGGSAWARWSMRRAMDAVLGSNHSLNDGPEPAHLLLKIEPDNYTSDSDDEEEDNSAASAIDSSPAPYLEQDNLSPAHTPEQNNKSSPAQQNERSPISPAGLGVDSNTVPNATIATIDHEDEEDTTNDLDDFDGDQEEAFDYDDEEEEEPPGNTENPPSASLAMIRARDQMDDEAEKERATARLKRSASAPV